MKVLRILMKPMKFVILLSMLAAIIYFRSVIFHSNVNQYINAAISYVEGRLDLSIPSHLAAVEKPATFQHECEEMNVYYGDKNPGVDSTPVTEVTVKEDTAAIMDVLSETMDAINRKVDMLFDAEKTVSAVEPVAGADAAHDTGSEISAVLATDSVSVDTKQDLLAARRLFWNGKVQESEELYLDLINKDNNDPDIFGELGNVYYTQGKWKQAGEAYYEAALRLLAQNRDERTVGRVNYMLRVIQGLDMVSAEKLRNKIAG